MRKANYSGPSPYRGGAQFSGPAPSTGSSEPPPAAPFTSTLGTAVVVAANLCQFHRDPKKTQQVRAWLSGGGIYVFGFNPGGSRGTIHKSADGGATFVRQDQADEKTSWSDFSAMAGASRLIGTTLVFSRMLWLSTSNNQRCYFYTFDCATDQYTSVLATVYLSTGNPAGDACVTLAEQAGDVIATFVSGPASESDVRRARWTLAGSQVQGAGLFNDASHDAVGAVTACGADGDRHHFYTNEADGVAYYVHDPSSFGTPVSLGFDGRAIAAVRIDSNRVICVFREDVTGDLKAIVATTTGSITIYTYAASMRGTDTGVGHGACDYDGSTYLHVRYVNTSNELVALRMAVSDGTFEVGAVAGTPVDFSLAGYLYNVGLAFIPGGAVGNADVQFVPESVS